MTVKLEPKKPKTIFYAEWALWGWTAWICLFGIYQSLVSLPGIKTMMDEQLQGMISFELKDMRLFVIASYLAMALTLVWFVFKIGQGKRWARTSLLIGVVLQALYIVMSPYQGMLNYLPDVPDIGLQVYALYLLYTWPGRTWFTRDEWAVDL